ncbi:MAG: MmgE/PrpD family protein [Chloroflexota bacterium]
MDRVLEFLSDYAVGLTFGGLPADAVHQVRRRVIDALGCALGAYAAEPPRIARSHALEVSASPGATVLGTSHVTAAELAAFANGVMVRYLDFNDAGLTTDPGHPSDNIPAVLAAAEYAGADLRTVITAIVLAYEVQGRFGEGGRLRAHGWDHVTFVALSAAAGAGKVLGLDRQQMANALALAATPNASLRQTRVGTLSMWKGCAAANAARNGVFAALLARRGLTGPEEAFEGRCGFLRQVTGEMELPAFGGDGRRFNVQDAKFKYYPAEYLAQCVVDPGIEIRRMLAGRVEEIEAINVETSDFAVDIAADSPDKWNPTTRETADHSIPYVLAVALTRGDVWLEDFSTERIADPAVHRLMQKIVVRSKEEYSREHPLAQCFRIEAVTRTGEKLVRETKYAKGHPKNPMTDAEIETKFRRLAQPILNVARVDQILQRLWHLEQEGDVRSLLGAFVLDSSGA